MLFHKRDLEKGKREMKIIFFAFLLTTLVCASSIKAGENILKRSVLNRAKKAILFDRFTIYHSQHDVYTNKNDLLRRKNLAGEKTRKENEIRQEDERRAKIFRQQLASRVQSSFIRDFLTQRY